MVRQSLSSSQVKKPTATTTPTSKKVLLASKIVSEKETFTVKKKPANRLLRKIKRSTKSGIKTLLLSGVFHKTCKLTSFAIIIISILYGSYLFIGKTFANEVIVSRSEIIARVSKLTNLPAEDPYEIVRVQDEEDLRKQNSFYKDVHEGDYILMYSTMAIVYDLRNNTILAIKRAEEN